MCLCPSWGCNRTHTLHKTCDTRTLKGSELQFLPLLQCRIWVTAVLAQNLLLLPRSDRPLPWRPDAVSPSNQKTQKAPAVHHQSQSPVSQAYSDRSCMMAISQWSVLTGRHRAPSLKVSPKCHFQRQLPGRQSQSWRDARDQASAS